MKMDTEADDVPLCGTGIFELLDTSTGFPTLPQKRDHVVALPYENIHINITIFENDTDSKHNVCLTSVIPKPVDDFEFLPTCYESLVDPCFDLQFVEDKADATLELIYRKFSIWEFPQRSEVNSTSDSMVLMLTMWNIDENSTLKHFLDSLFPFMVVSLSNDVLVVGSPSENILSPNQSSIGFIESPRYPDAYPRSLVKRYMLVNSKPNGYVRLLFDDFHVHFQSEMQIFDSDGHQLINTKAENRRPSAILSTGNRLTIQFKAHDFTQTVHYASLWFKSNRLVFEPDMNSSTIDNGPTNQIHGVEEFHMKGVGLRLEIREGASSTSDRLLLLFDSHSRDQLEHKQPSGGLEIVYAQFYRWATALCPGVGEYHCDNSRCIKATLRCDGIDHCGDGSDEQCQRPIFDFKQPDTDISGLIALVIGVCGLVLVIISTTAVLGRFYRRRFASQNNGTTISVNPFHPHSTAVPSMQTVGERRFYVVPESQISVIEAPPSYDDALKHPAVQSLRSSAYLNQGYVSSASEEQIGESSTSELPSIRDLGFEETVNNTMAPNNIGNETASVEDTTSPVETQQTEENTSGVSSNTRRQDDESWV
uniref:CUB domain-containing protein n=1 Tax=Angiostrongylus cantonensis TaxID=6313 RepID=A0A158P8P0_ANGCA